MKTFVKFLSVLAVMFVFAACSEDIYLHDGKDGLNGKDGIDGQDGKDGYTTYEFFDSISNQTVHYLDIDRNKSFSEPDSTLFVETEEGLRVTKVGECVQITYVDGTNETTYMVCNGKDGEDGKTPELKFTTDVISIDNLCRVRIVYLNNNELWRDTICSGENAEPYNPQFSSDVVPIDEFCRIRNFYIDGAIFYSDTICDGQPGEPGEPGQNNPIIYPLPPFWDDCNTGNSYNAEAEGYHMLGTPWSRNINGAPNKNGTLVDWDWWYTGPDSTVWSPVFSPSAIDYQSFDLGSKGEWNVSLHFLRENGDTITVKAEKIIPNKNGFVWYDPATYVWYDESNAKHKQKFVYSVDPSEIKFQDIVRFGISVEKAGDFEVPDYDNPDWRNWVCNIDNIYVHRIKIIQ